MKKNLCLIKALCIAAITAFGFVNCGFAQTVAGAAPAPWDSTYRPKIYPAKVAGFNADPITKNDIVFLGNSITAHADWAKLLDEPRAKNRGISGDITFGVLERLDEVVAGNPKKIFVLVGINDISRNIPDSLIIRNYHRIIARIRAGSPSTQIYFCTLLPVNASFKKFMNHYGKDEHILAINEAIKKLAAKKVAIIDLYPHFLDDEQHLVAAYTEDGLHPNAAGYRVWIKLLKDGNYLE